MSGARSSRGIWAAAAWWMCLACVALTGCTGGGDSGWKEPAGEPIDLGARQREGIALAEQAQAADQKGKTEEAIELYRRALGAFADMPAAWNNLGALLLQEKRYAEAAEAFRVAADLSPGDPRPLVNLGLTWEGAGWPADARQYYERALEIDPSNLIALRRSIYLDVTRGEVGDATTTRLRRALLVETDPQWRAYFERQATTLTPAQGVPGVRRPG